MLFSTRTSNIGTGWFAEPAHWLALVRRMLPGGHVTRGGEYTGVVNPLRDDRNAGSVFVNVTTQAFVDSAAPDTFAGTGPYLLLARLLRLDPQADNFRVEAVLRFLSGETDKPAGVDPRLAGPLSREEIDAARQVLAGVDTSARAKTEIEFMPLPAVDDIATLASAVYPGIGRFEKAFPVLDGAGVGVAFELRFIDAAGEKHVRPLAYGRDVAQGSEFPPRWVAKWPPALPWHGEPDIGSKPADAIVEIVEGPKTRAARAAMRPDRVVLSAVAGLEDRHPWQCFTGRTVLVIADADDAGRQQAEKIDRRLRAVRAVSAIVTWPDSFPRGWDFADPPPAGWSPERIEDVVSAKLVSTLAMPKLPADFQAQQQADFRMELLEPAEVLVSPPHWPVGALAGFDGLVDDLARASGSARGYIATALLTTVSGLSLGSLQVEPIPGWRTHPILWAVLSGSSSAGKTPALRLVTQPLHDVRAAFVAKAIRDRRDWEDLDKKQRGDEPVPIEILLADDTIEAEHMALAEQRAGLLKVVQESAAFISDLQRYNANIRGARLASYDGGPLTVRRKHLAAPLNIPLNGISLLTTGQPDILSDLFHDRVRDGMVQRFNFAMHAGDVVAGVTDPVVLEMALSRLRRVFQRLVELRLMTAGAPAKAGSVAPAQVPVITFSPEAQELFREANARLRQRYARHSEFMASWSAKGVESIARISGALHALAWADSDQILPRPDSVIGADTVARGAAIVETYFAQHTEIMHRISEEPVSIRNARALAWHLIRSQESVIDTADIRHGSAVAGLREEKVMREAIIELQAAGWLAPGTYLSRSGFDQWPTRIALRADLHQLLAGKV
jgi:hypothetical protein